MLKHLYMSQFSELFCLHVAYFTPPAVYLVLVKTHGRILLDGSKIDLVAEKFSDVGDAILDHGGSLQTQSKAKDLEVFWQAHRLQHLGPEHTAVTDLDNLAKTLVVREDLHAGLGIGVKYAT